jgi:hypothetical protein
MARANTDNPNLSVWMMGFKAIASGNFALINFKVLGFEIDCHDFAVIPSLNL